MNEQAMRFRVGLFVLAAMLLLAVLITLFGGFPNYFKPSTSYSIIFDNAQGVAPGTPVRRSGVKIGEVRKITLDNETGKVEVEIQVDAGYTLRKGDKATLLPGLLGGDNAIGFRPPPEGQPVDTTPVEPGSVLPGFTQADASTVLQKTAEVMPPAQEALTEVKVVFQKIDKMTPLLEETLRELRSVGVVFQKIDKMTPLLEDTFREFRDVGRVTREMVPELRKTNDEIRELAKSARLTVPDLRRTNDEIQLTTRTWGKLGERMDLLLQTNEDKLVKTIEQMQMVMLRVSEVLNEENQKNLRDTLRNVRISSDRFDSIAKNTEEFLKDSRITIQRLNDSLIKADEVLGNVQKVTRPLGERGESILRNIDESTDKLNKTLGDFREVLQAVARSEGSLQRLLTDPSLYNNLNEAACTISKIMPRVDRIMRDVEIFADKIARHPESLGVGGAVRPSSGLKESPTPYRIIPLHP